MNLDEFLKIARKRMEESLYKGPDKDKAKELERKKEVIAIIFERFKMSELVNA